MSGRPTPPPRNLLRIVFRNFLRSLTGGYRRAAMDEGGKFIGKDYLGYKYFEKQADPSRGRRLPIRYFEAVDRENFTRETMPAEWESWLRHRRNEPPTEEEIEANLQIAKMKKANAAAITTSKPAHSHDFPLYEEYEINPGPPLEKRDTDPTPNKF